MNELPRPDTSRFSQISPELLVLSYLLGSKRAISLGTLKTRLKAFVSPQIIEEAVSALVAGHQAIPKKSIELTREGKDAVEKALGRDAGQGWEEIWHRRLPLLALGLDHDDGETLRKFASADAQKAATIAVSYGLPKEIMASKPGVCAELVWRTLKARLSEVVGNGPFPPIQKLGTVERIVLAGLANIRARSVTEAVDGVAAAAVGLQKCDVDTFRRRLIVLVVEQSSGQRAPAELGALPRSCLGCRRKRGTREQAFGRSRGGFTCKVHCLSDARGSRSSSTSRPAKQRTAQHSKR